MSLAVFDISKVVENGVEITPEVDPSSGLVRYVAYPIASPVLVWTYTLQAIPSLSSALSSLALQKPLGSFNRMLTTKRKRANLEKHILNMNSNSQTWHVNLYFASSPTSLWSITILCMSSYFISFRE